MKRKHEPPGSRLKGRWSYKHKCCRHCKTTKIKHMSRGLCKVCYPRDQYPIKSKYRDHEVTWAHNYDECTQCHSAEHKHSGKGVCIKCRGKKRSLAKRKTKYGDTAWSRNYKCCKACETTEVKHNAQGYCMKCYTDFVASPKYHEAKKRKECLYCTLEFNVDDEDAKEVNAKYPNPIFCDCACERDYEIDLDAFSAKQEND